MQTNRFLFGIGDLGRFLNKSPVTIRLWERQNMLQLPRNNAGERELTLEGVAMVARLARRRGRISQSRLELIEQIMKLLNQVERENR